MNDFLKKLEPQPVWQYFREILEVPRPSKKEQKIIAYLEAFAANHKLGFEKDEIGNILITKSATKGFENRQTVVLQSHVDMVCEKNSGVKHDFEKDPIKTHIVDGWLKAKGTTLGADDGIGVAIQLAILAADNLQHGPIECLFTVDEETGLTGAFGLSKDFLKGRILLNLDSEDDGELFIGCAGGKGTTAKLAFDKEVFPANQLCYRIWVKGLKGGHSGDDIHRGLGNANKILNRCLWEINQNFEISLCHIDGGNLHNAIAREAFADVVIMSHQLKDVSIAIKSLADQIRSEYSITEPGLRIEILPSEASYDAIVNRGDLEKLLNSVYACPHGVLAMSQSIPGFVETSTNLASIKQKEDHWIIGTSQRSSVASALVDASQMIAACFKLAGAEVSHSDGYPGWAPNPKSIIREITEKAYISLFKEKPEVKAIHAGLECGLIGDKYPGMDMISYGPTIKGAHSPDERIKIDTVDKFWELTLEILKNIPKKHKYVKVS
jgi:dipeptidase D